MPTSRKTMNKTVGDMDGTNSATTIPELLTWRSKLLPDKIAYSAESTSGWLNVTWSEYATKIENLAHALKGNGLRKGDVMIIAIPTSAEWELLHLAALRLGAIVLGIDPSLSKEQFLSIVAETNCQSLILIDNQRLTNFSKLSTNLQFVVTINGDSSRNTLPFPVFSFNQLSSCSKMPSNQSLPFPDAQDPATIVYTSGTTGQPKGIIYTHNQILQAIAAISEVLSIGENDVTISWLPLSALFQRMINLVSISTGASIFFIKEPAKLMQYLPTIRPTLLFGVPRFYEKVQQQIEREISGSSLLTRLGFCFALDLFGKNRPQLERLPGISIIDRLFFQRIRLLFGGRMKLMLTGSAPLEKRCIEFFNAIGLNLREAYAISENIIPMTMNTLKENRAGSVGKPLVNNEIHIGENGEILVRGPGVFQGYYHKNSIEKPSFSDGFYITGDLGFFDKDGFLYLTGRNSDVVKSSTGQKLPLNYIEAHYNGIPYVDSVVIIGSGRKCVVALVTINQDVFREYFGQNLVFDYEPPDKVKEKVKKDILSAGQDLAEFQRIKSFAVLKQPFRVEAGELTSSLKLRRRFIESAYQSIIEAMYRRLDELDENDKQPHKFTDKCLYFLESLEAERV